MKRVTSLILPSILLFSISSIAHAEISDCRIIEDNLERLNCYDLLPLIDEEPGDSADPTKIFETLRQLMRYQSDPLEFGLRGRYTNTAESFGDDVFGWATSALRDQSFPTGLGYRFALIQEDVRFSGCHIYLIGQWEVQGIANMGRQDTDRDGDGFADVSRGSQIIATFLKEINLEDVDVSKTFLTGNEMTMVRDANISNSTFGRIGWRDPTDLLIESEDGDLIPTFNDHLTTMSTQNRSLKLEFGKAYPEDQSEIKREFLKLINACQM